MMEPRQSTTVPNVSKTSAFGITVAADPNFGRATSVTPPAKLFNACLRFMVAGIIYNAGNLRGGTMRRIIFLLVFCWAAMILTAEAQCLNYRNPKTPRTADGKPDLKAPAPKLPDGTPDLSATWAAPNGKYLENLGADGIEIPMQPWAEQLYKERVA